jgi:hypothetical protein
MGHGLLTYHLLQALLGPEEVIKQGRVPIYGLLSYVTTQVIATASGTYAARQEPTLRGQMDGAITWPPFRPGPLFHNLFPEKSSKPVTSELRSLESHGIAEAVVKRWSASLPSLNELQQSVVNNAGLLDGKNVLVTAPTSSGKTMLGELAALNASQRGGRSVFLLPTRALVNEQYERFARTYSDLGYRVVRVTGEISDQLPEFMLGQFDIALLTYEKFAGLALGTSHVPDQTLAMSPLGRLVARSGLAVKSAITVTRTLRSLAADELNRATLIAIAQLTEEVEQVQFPLNYKGYRAEMSTFGPELQRQRIAGAAMAALQRAAPGQQHIAAKRAKKTVACLLWTTGVPAASFEPALMKHMKDRDAIGPVRAVTSRTRDVIDTVIAIAREAHPEAELDALAELLPVQLELGVPANIVWLARTAGAAISRQAYLNLSKQQLTSPDAIHAATDEVLMECIGDSQEAIHSLRTWAEQSRQITDDVPRLDDLLGLPVD